MGDLAEGWDDFSYTKTAGFKAGFDFAKQMRHKTLRDRIDALGARGMHVLPAGQDTTVSSVLHLARANGVTGRWLLALVDEAAPNGFRLAVVEMEATDG